MCKKYNVNYSSAHSFGERHPELTNEQIIIHFRPNLYINMMGEIVGD